MNEAPPLLLHFDVNKTVVQSDSVQLKSTEDGAREGIAELFWGYVKKNQDGQLVWEWDGGKSTGDMPQVQLEEGQRLMNYSQFCKEVVKDKTLRKQTAKSFSLVNPPSAKEAMETMLSKALDKMLVPPELAFTPEAIQANIKGTMVVMIPAFFHFIANLQLSNRTFSLLFRSFGGDHDTIKTEWNAFCEMKHPLFSHLLRDCGALDGSTPGVPDRRVHGIHTLYRDAEGPVLMLNTFTNGPEDALWDKWAKKKPKPKADERNGREYMKNVLKCETVEGHEALQRWLKDSLLAQESAAIKDDWAWWTWHGESEDSGKLLLLLDSEGREETRQIFYDDNIEHDSTRIVDCRNTDGSAVQQNLALGKLCTKVNSVEALLSNNYFLDRLGRCHSERLEAKASMADTERQLEDLKKWKLQTERQVEAMKKEMQGMVEENRRMKLMRKINVSDEEQLQKVLTDAGIADKFGQESFKSIQEFWKELEEGGSWLEYDEHGALVRIIEVCFLKIKFKDRLLIESHEQAGDRITSRNYLAGVRKTLDHTFKEVIDRFFESGLNQVDIRSVVTTESLPVFVPDAPEQITGATAAFPIKCKMQQSEATYIIKEGDVEGREDISKIGLPLGKSFTTLEVKDDSSITHFWRWDKVASWEAMSSRMAKKGASAQVIDIAMVCEKLFRGHPRREVYENLLLQMFETFTAKKLAGGFSGSLVIRVQPYEHGGKLGDPCIVKMDAGDAIREEYINSVAVFEALPDRAARILGDAVYAKNKEEEEFGAMRLELAGACWNVPELAQGGGTLLSTFKDLLVYESEQTMLGKNDTTDGVGRPFGNTNSILAETFGPGGIVASLRRGGDGMNRHKETDLLWGWYTLKGKVSKYNPFNASPEEYPPAPAMKKLYKKYFGHDMPDLKAVVVDKIKPMLIEMSSNAPADLFPLVGLAHGDLNAANIMIDAMDAVWLIDFATSVELPLFTDMCKFEMASLFEYAAIPITPEMLLEFASTNKKIWDKINVGDWLRVDQDVAQILLTDLIDLGPEKLAAMNQSMLEKIIEETAAKTGKAPHKQIGIIRALKSRLVANEALMDYAFSYCGVCSPALLCGDFLTDALYMTNPTPPASHAMQGSASLRFFMDVACSVRRLMAQDIMNMLRSTGVDQLQAVDGMCLQLWLPFLRESYRIIGYRDISPQQKIWSMYHCKIVSEVVLRTLETLKQSWSSLKDLQVVGTMREAISQSEEKSHKKADDKGAKESTFTEVESLWFFSNKHLFPASTYTANLIRRVHAMDAQHRHKPGVFAPIFQVSFDGFPQLLSFDPTCTPAADEWSLYLEDDAAGIDSKQLIGTVKNLPLEDRGDLREQDVWVNQVSTTLSVCSDQELSSPSPAGETSDDHPGTPPPEGNVGYAHKITLKSRLFSLTSELVTKHQGDIMFGKPLVRDNFSIYAWSGDLITDSEQLQKAEKRGKRTSLSPRSKNLFQYLHLKCTAYSPDGQNQLSLKLVLGDPICCYPAGSKISCDQAAMPPGMPWFPRMVVWSLDPTGSYDLRDVNNPDKEIDHEFNPQPLNHTYCDPADYQVGQRVIIVKDQMSFEESTVLELPSLNNGWRHALQLRNHDDQEDASGKAGAVVFKHLDLMNSSLIDVPADAFEDELTKVRSNVKARHSFLIDALSGMRLEVKECAMPTLTVTSPAFTPPPAGNDVSVPSSPKGAGNRQRLSHVAIKQGVPDDNEFESKTPDKKAGWQNIMSCIEAYDKREPCLGPNAFLVVGLPGSGKTSLITRCIVDCLEKQRSFVPILVPVADLLKKIAQAGDSFDMNTSQPSVFFDMYLRTVFGEDSQRYKTIMQAKLMHRVMFLFQGLDSAGAVGPFIEKMIKELIFERHLLLITSRPFLEGAYSLPTLHSYVSAMQLEKFNDEQKHWVAQVRLGAEGLKSYEKFVKKLKESHLPSEEQDGEEGEEQEDVFGNPMMLSMLLIYLLVRQKKKDEAMAEGNHNEGDEEITQSAVYRVAIDVMLGQILSKSQADRHNKEEKMEQCKKVLERLAMEMQIRRTQELDADEVSKFLPDTLEGTWNQLRGAVAAGHAMFLRMPTGNNLRFFVKGFQNYFSACQVVRDKGDKLPALEPLLTDSWWAEMLEMLADTDSHTFVEFIESAVKDFVPRNGWSFLHAAASVGHRPIFQHFEYFQESTQKELASKTENLFTPLHVAAEKGNTQLCKLMIDHKAPMDAEDKDGCLPLHVALQNGQFTSAKYLLDRWMAHYGDARRDVTSNAAEEIARRILSKQISEEEFIEVVKGEFVELRFYVKNFAADGQKALAALLSTYWVCGDHYDKFVRSQDSEKTRLSPNSWTSLQTWASDDVQLTRDAEIVGAMLQFLSMSNVGKILPFRKTFAPGYDDPAESLAHVLRHYPMLLPSFSRLSDDMQQMILFSARADFNFGQFLQAENLPANLNTVKTILSEASGKNNVFGFFLFRIFAAMCGLRGDKTLEGSLMMTDPLFCNFKLGLDVLNYLKDKSAQDVSARFLGKKADVLQIQFDPSDPESKALVRLCILCRVLDKNGVAQITEAWRQMEPEKLSALVEYLNTDGISRKPGFLLFNAPQFMDIAKSNPKIGPIRAMQMLLRIYQAANKEYSESKKQVITVFVNDMVDWAKKSSDGDIFDFTRFVVARSQGTKSEVLGSVVISPWKLVNDSEELDKVQEQREQLVHKLQAGAIKEAPFLRRIEESIPELAFFEFSGEIVTSRQTRCALLSLYWIITDQPEAFSRGHSPDEKLTEATWSHFRKPLEPYMERTGTVEAWFVAVSIMNLGRLKQFKEQLAPDSASGHQDVLNHVIETCPKVLPSFCSLDTRFHDVLRTVLSVNFEMLHLMTAENVAFNLLKIKEMAVHGIEQNLKSVNEVNYVYFYIFVKFVELSGSMGDQSLDGSLFMTEPRYGIFLMCSDLLINVAKKEISDIKDIYVDYLEKRSNGLGIPFDRSNRQTLCVTRLASLCQCFKQSGGQAVMNAFNQLSEEERETLTEHLTADGFTSKPAFVLVYAPDFLQSALGNSQVGLLPALRILLRVCVKAAREVGDTLTETPDTIEVHFRRLTVFTKDFLGSVSFADAPFVFKYVHKTGVSITPKAWIPVNNLSVLESLSGQAKELCSGLLEDKITEPDFISIAKRTYPELTYFSHRDAVFRDQTRASMLSIYWLITANHEAFCRQQPEEEQLTATSWAWIQEWVVDWVKIKTPEAVDAIMVFMAMHALGKIKEFREEFAPKETEAHHDAVLARVLRSSPEVIPSFMRLKPEYQTLIVDSLRVDFQFHQLLQAENVPANLVMVKDVLGPHGEEAFAFFCFRIFTVMCGRNGHTSLEGSLFMTEAQFQRFRPGLEAVQRLWKLDAAAAYKTFLLQKASKTLVRFASLEHYAIARLLCLCSALDTVAGDNVLEAFESLPGPARHALASFLSSDGITSCPGYVLNELSTVIQLAQTNRAVGLIAALQMLAKIQSACENVVRQYLQMPEKVIVQMDNVITWTKECGPDPAEFSQAVVSVRQTEVADGRSDAMVLRVDIKQPTGTAVLPHPNGVTNGAAEANGVTNGAVEAKGVPNGAVDANGVTNGSVPAKPLASKTHLKPGTARDMRKPAGGIHGKSSSRTRRLAQMVRAERKKMAEGKYVEVGTVTSL